MQYEVKLEVEADATKAEREKFGHLLMGWRPAMQDRPAIAYFEFSTQAGRDEFLAVALQMRGVRLAE